MPLGGITVGRYVRIDRRYNQPYRLTGNGCLAVLKWTGIIVAWVVVNSIVSAYHLPVLILVTTAGLVWYVVYSVRRNRSPRLAQPPAPLVIQTAIQWQLNAPPGWPTPPDGWSPSPGWQPDPSWPPPPPGWQLWIPVPPACGAVGERNTRVIPQDVKIAVSVRDQGMCVQCGSREDLHYDHKIPWSRGGTNTVNNIQLLCGACNRIKGADDIPLGPAERVAL
jgi:hypothetical protein